MLDTRQIKGMEIAAMFRITKKDDGSWLVPSQAGAGRYLVKVGDAPHCTCPDYEQRGGKCKHIWAVEYVAQRETTQNADGSTTVTETVTIKATKRTTYAQNWPAYNKAQTNEQDEFQRLLGDLCAGIEDARPARRPRADARRSRCPMRCSPSCSRSTARSAGGGSSRTCGPRTRTATCPDCRTSTASSTIWKTPT
jgi:hypothetical protein